MRGFLVLLSLVFILWSGPALADCDNPALGASCRFHARDYGTGGAQDTFVDATCRRIGSYSYLYVADDLANDNVLSESHLDEFMEALETGWSGKEAIFEGIGDLVGYAPDVNDYDPKVYILVHDFNNLIPGKYVAYFRPEDVTRNDPDGNDREVLFVDSGSDSPLFDLAGEMSEKHLSWLAYSLCAMTGYVSDPSEDDWVVDSICRAATYLTGYTSPFFKEVSDFSHEPTFPLLGRDGELDDGATLLWGLYFYDSFGQGQATEILNFWLNEDKQGIEGFEAVLDLTAQENPTFAYELHQWVHYNFIGKEPYAYLSAPVPVFSPNVIQEHPREKMVSVPSFGGQSLKIYLTDVGNDPLEITMETDDRSALKTSYWIDRGSNPSTNDVVDVEWPMTGEAVKLTFENLSNADNIRLFFSYAAPGDYKEVTVKTRIVTDDPVDGDMDDESGETTSEDESTDEPLPGDEDDPAETAEEEASGPSGSYSCKEIALCVEDCLQQICFERCRERGRLDQQTLWDEYNACLQGDVPNPTGTNCLAITDQEERAYCIYKNCNALAEACEPDEDGTIKKEKTGSSSCRVAGVGTGAGAAVLWMLWLVLRGRRRRRV